MCCSCCVYFLSCINFVSTFVCCVSLCFLVCCASFFFFKQKTAYEMRISDWSSDVCSSDLPARPTDWPSRLPSRQRGEPPMTRSLIFAGSLLAVALLAGCGEPSKTNETSEPAAASAAADYERGPHRGRILRDGDFAVEVTLFEDGVDPEFHVYAYRNDKPVAPGAVQLSIELARLGGQVDSFAFTPQEAYLRGGGVVIELNSFDVKVRAVEGGRTHNWS